MLLNGLSDAGLMGELTKLRGEENKILASFLLHLREVKERDLHLREGYSSLFEFLVQKVGYSEGSAARRVAAVKVMEMYPEAIELIGAGKVHLSALHLLVKHLKKDNAERLVGACVGVSKRRVEEMLVRDFGREISERESVRVVKIAEAFAEKSEPKELDAMQGTVPLFDATSDEKAPSPEKGEERVRVSVTLSSESYRKLQRVLEITGRNQMAEAIDQVVDFFLKRKDPDIKRDAQLKKKAPVKKTEIRKATRGKGRAKIKETVKATVYARDNGQCSFVSPAGRRCTAKKHLHYDHKTPYSVGGQDTPENLRLMCRTHNAQAARQFFGKEFMAAFTRDS